MGIWTNTPTQNATVWLCDATADVDYLRSLLPNAKDRTPTGHVKLAKTVIQFPQDIVAIQEVIWKCKPNVIIETGVARGGSLVLSASVLQIIGSPGIVVGVDIDIRQHNRPVTTGTNHRGLAG